MKFFKLSYFLFLFISINSCKEEVTAPDCQNYAVEFGTFLLTPSTVNLFPYSETDSVLIFNNDMGEQLNLKLEFFNRDTLTHSYLDQCPYDKTVEIPYVYRKEIISVAYDNDSLQFRIILRFEASYQKRDDKVTGQSDIAELSVSKTSPGLAWACTSLIRHKSGIIADTSNRFFPSLQLGPKIFTDVYSIQTAPGLGPDYIPFMNYDLGIVGIEESAIGKVWAFDRKK